MIHIESIANILSIAKAPENQRYCASPVRFGVVCAPAVRAVPSILVA
jgi:hypothetical protein